MSPSDLRLTALVVAALAACSTAESPGPNDGSDAGFGDAEAGCPPRGLGATGPVSGVLYIATDYVLYLEIGDLDPADVRVWCGRSDQEPGEPQPMTMLAPGLLRVERCPGSYQVDTSGGEAISLEIGSHPIGYWDHTPPELDAQLRLHVATSTETSCGAQSTVRADYEPGRDPEIGMRSVDGGSGVVTGGSGEWFGVRVHLLYEHPRSPESTAVGYSMSTWTEPYTGPRRSWIPLDDLPSGRHCYVLGAMDNSGNLTVDEAPACIDVP